MSAWFEAIGSLFIALGAYTTWRDSHILVLGPYRRDALSRAERGARRQALTKLRFSLYYIALGVLWVTAWITHPIVVWLLGGYLLVLVTYDLSAWIRSLKRRNSGGQTA
jgi:hypothetical protein